MSHPLIILRLMLPYPQKGGKKKTGVNRVHHPLADMLLTQSLLHPLYLLRRAGVAVEDGRANHLVGLIQEHSPVHLSGEADSRHLIRGNAALLKHTLDGAAASFPPFAKPPWGEAN